MFLFNLCNIFQSSCDQLCWAKSLIMKTKPIIQNQLVAHTVKDEILYASEKPKDPKTEDLPAESALIKNSFAEKLSSPFDLFENVTTGSNSIQDRNRGVTNTNLSDQTSSEES